MECKATSSWFNKIGLLGKTTDLKSTHSEEIRIMKLRGVPKSSPTKKLTTPTPSKAYLLQVKTLHSTTKTKTLKDNYQNTSNCKTKLTLNWKKKIWRRNTDLLTTTWSITARIPTINHLKAHLVWVGDYRALVKSMLIRIMMCLGIIKTLSQKISTFKIKKP